MHVRERQAWFVLAVTATTLLLAIILVTLLGFTPPASAAFGVLGLVGATGLIGRRERRAGRVVIDERDREIERAATVAGYSVFWLLFVAAAMAPFFILGPGAVMRVPTIVVPTAIYVAACIVYLVRALAMILLYRMGNDGRAG